MKKASSLFAALIGFSVAMLAHGQVFVYDQQSSDESNTGEGVGYIQSLQPFGQSFTPTLNSVGFIRLYMGDSSFNAVGATVHLNLLTNSITGPVLASTDPVSMPDGFVGYVNFFFLSPVSITPGVTYCFQPVVESGDTWGVAADTHFNYAGGTAFHHGAPDSLNFDLWFREGIIVPEPSAALLFLLAGSTMVWLRRVSFSRIYGLYLFEALRPGRGV